MEEGVGEGVGHSRKCGSSAFAGWSLPKRRSESGAGAAIPEAYGQPLDVFAHLAMRCDACASVLTSSGLTLTRSARRYLNVGPDQSTSVRSMRVHFIVLY